MARFDHLCDCLVCTALRRELFADFLESAGHVVDDASTTQPPGNDTVLVRRSVLMAAICKELCYVAGVEQSPRAYHEPLTRVLQ